MCRKITTAPATCPCPCAAISHDVTTWCNACYIALQELERDVALEVPREYRLHDVVVAVLREQSTTALALAALQSAIA